MVFKSYSFYYAAIILLLICIGFNIYTGSYINIIFGTVFAVILIHTIFITRHEKIRALQTQYYTDYLTGLSSRVKLLEDLKDEKYCNIILVNIDDFKEINDFYGQNVGDFVLIQLAAKLKALLSQGNFYLYRLHSDEFTIVSYDDMTAEKLKELIVYVHTSVTHKFFQYNGNDITVNITMGVASGCDNMLEKADMALKFAKKNKRNYFFYDNSMSTLKEYENNLNWGKIIKNAVAENKVFPCYQPIYCSKSGDIEKFECLARIAGKDGVAIPAIEFISIAKKLKLCTYITRIIINKSFTEFRNRDKAFSINLSSEDIMNVYTSSFVMEHIKKHNIAPRVIFEILESESIENYEEVSKFIALVKSLGCKIAIDDFGSGYSNFNNILKLNVDYLKIDGSLIENIDKKKNSQVIVRSIVSFAKELGIQTVAEFVSTKEANDMVKILGVDYLQGYYLQKPSCQI